MYNFLISSNKHKNAFLFNNSKTNIPKTSICNNSMTCYLQETKRESNIDIIARPPGKKVKKLNALSAGEKALTAISILFA